MINIDYFFALTSPWSYFAGLRLEEIAARRGAVIHYRPMDVLALFDRTGGVRPAARHPNRMAYRQQELARWSARLGMPIVTAPKSFPPNPAPASYALIAAQNAGGGDMGGLVHAMLAATWVEDRDIAQDDVIREKLAAFGFDPALAMTGLFQGALAYEKNLDEAVERGVFGAPFYIVRETDQRFWGQDRLDFLDEHLESLA